MTAWVVGAFSGHRGREVAGVCLNSAGFDYSIPSETLGINGGKNLTENAAAPPERSTASAWTVCQAPRTVSCNLPSQHPLHHHRCATSSACSEPSEQTSKTAGRSLRLPGLGCPPWLRFNFTELCNRAGPILFGGL